jgi:hypothetical protein
MARGFAALRRLKVWSSQRSVVVLSARLLTPCLRRTHNPRDSEASASTFRGVGSIFQSSLALPPHRKGAEAALG